MSLKEEIVQAVSRKNRSLSSLGSASKQQTTLFDSSQSRVLGRSSLGDKPGSSITKDAGDSIGDASSLGRLSSGGRRERTGKVSRSDPDFYRFKVGKNNKVTLRLLNSEDKNVAIVGSLLNSQGRVVRSGSDRLIQTVRSGSSRLFEAKNLSAGTYFIRLTTLGNRVDFQITLIVR